MLNYTNFLYFNIGQRIKAFRTDNKKTQEDFCGDFNDKFNTGLCPRDLSRIEHGKILKTVNPYLLSKNQINYFSKMMNISDNELIWGNEQEKQNFIQIILLSLIMNGEKVQDNIVNPIYYYENHSDFLVWALKQTSLDNETRGYLLTAQAVIESKNFNANEKISILPAEEYRSESDEFDDKSISITIKELYSQISSFFDKKYGFFFNDRNHTCYEKIKNGFDEEYEEISNLLLKLLLKSPKFAQLFYDRLSNSIWNSKEINRKSSKEFINKVNDFIVEKGQYGVLALDNLEYNYYEFIKAFNKFWEKNKNIYIEFFNKHIFLYDDLPENGLKHFNNEFFHNLLTSKEFIKLNRDIDNLNRYYDQNAILSNYHLESTIQELLVRNDLLYEKISDSSMYIYISKISEITNEFIDKCISEQ